MTSETLRSHLADADLSALSRAASVEAAERAFRGILDRWSDEERSIDTAPSSRDAIARHAAELHFSAHPDRWIVGGLAAGRAGQAPIDRDGSVASKALAVALRETAFPDVRETHEVLRGAGRLALRHEADGRETWEKALRTSLGTFAANARAVGASREVAALRALKASVALTGEASADDEDGLAALAAGRALAALLRQEPSEASPESSLLEALASGVAVLNDARACLWEGVEDETARLFGAAALRAAFGKGSTDRPRAVLRRPAFDGGTLVFDDATSAAFPEAWHARLSHLNLSSARQALEAVVADERAPSGEREAAEKLASLLEGRADAEETALWEHLGYEPPELREAPFRPGAPVRFAAPRGRRQARLLGVGKRGRPVRARAVVDDRGDFVGYLAFDPFSREFGGRPLYAAYDAGGARRGYAWADEAPRFRAGEPEQGFVTAPEALAI